MSGVAVALGAWMLYLTVGVLIALIPKPWPAADSFRGQGAWLVPAALGVGAWVQQGQVAYALAGLIAAGMMFALIRKRAKT